MSAKLWISAGELAARTPASRNRSIDLLRAVSILCVVLGHWLMAAVAYCYVVSQAAVDTWGN